MNVGDKATFTKTIGEEDVILFSKITGDDNPIHLDDNYARKSRFGRRVAHGLISLGLISAVLGKQLPGPGTIYLNQEVKFISPVYPGDPITATVEVMEIRPDKKLAVLKTECHNQNGQPILTGKATVLYDG